MALVRAYFYCLKGCSHIIKHVIVPFTVYLIRRLRNLGDYILIIIGLICALRVCTILSEGLKLFSIRKGVPLAQECFNTIHKFQKIAISQYCVAFYERIGVSLKIFSCFVGLVQSGRCHYSAHTVDS